jgi:uncharacterized protein YbjT (DUF2867 family)
MILVTGATGTIGRPLVNQLISVGEQVRAITHHSAASGLPKGIELAEGDLSRPDTIAPALRDVTALFVHPRAVGTAAPALLQLAGQHGVKHVVALSAINVDDDPVFQPSRANGDRNKEVEDAVVDSGLSWVSVRAGSFAVSISTVWAAQIRTGADVVHGPFADFAEAVIHEQDLAAVIAAGLRDQRLAGQRIDVTGPQSLTYAEMVTTIGEVIGRPLRYQELSVEAATEGMVSQGVSRPFVEALMARYRRDIGQPARVTGEVEKILGRPAKTYADWVTDHAAAFATAESISVTTGSEKSR